MRVLQAATRTSNTEMYSRGRRGAPAKGVGRLSRRESSNLSISAIQVHNRNVVDLLFFSNKVINIVPKWKQFASTWVLFIAIIPQIDVILSFWGMIVFIKSSKITCHCSTNVI